MIGTATSRASLRSAGFSDRAIGARPPKQSERSCSRVKKNFDPAPVRCCGPEHTRAAPNEPEQPSKQPERLRAVPIGAALPRSSRVFPSGPFS